MTIYRAVLPTGDVIESPFAKVILCHLAGSLRESGMNPDRVWAFIARSKGFVWWVIPQA